jgi:hypothetical protein
MSRAEGQHERGHDKQGPTSRGCQARNRQGEPCQAAPLSGSKWCFMHHPQRARERAEARKRGGHNRRTPRAAGVDGPTSLRSLDDVKALLEEALADTRLQENSAARSRTMVSIALTAIRCVEVGDLEERVARLEEAVSVQAGTPWEA